MKRSVVILLLMAMNFQAHALFQDIYKGYQVSNRMQELRLSDQIIAADLDFGKNKFDWSLDLSANNSNSFLKSLFSFQSQQTITDTYSFGISKSSYKYGSLSLTHSQLTYDISNWAQSALSTFSGDEVFEVKNQLTYQYEILNKNLMLDWDELLAKNNADRLAQSLNIEKDSLDFFNAYLSAKLRIMLDRLNREFESRAKTRVSKVFKRVKDGLSRRVDLKQAELSLLTNQETIIKNESTLRESVAVLEDIIKKPITTEDYKKVNWTYKKSNEFIYINEHTFFKDVKRIDLLNKVSDIQLLKLSEQSSHSLKLNLSYTKNAVDEKRTNAFDDSLGSGNNDEKIIGLVYSIPLGGDKKNALRKKLTLQKAKNELRLKNRESELNIQSKVLTENIKRYEKAINLLNKKVSLAKQVVKDTQRYYNRGQLSFEDTLRAEENYINAKISQVNMYALYEGALAQKAFLSGHILKFLGEYRD